MKKDPTALYEKYEKMIHDRARSVHYQTGYELDELVSEANYQFIQAVDSWDEKRSSFSTWLYSTLTMRLRNFVGKNYQQYSEVEPENIKSTYGTESARRRMRFRERMKDLSDEAQYVAKIFLESPCEVLHILGTETPKAIRGILRIHLREEKKWSWPKIWGSFREVKQFVAEM